MKLENTCNATPLFRFPVLQLLKCLIDFRFVRRASVLMNSLFRNSYINGSTQLVQV